MTLARQTIKRNGKAVGRIEETGRGDVQATCARGWTQLYTGWTLARTQLEEHADLDCAHRKPGT